MSNIISWYRSNSSPVSLIRELAGLVGMNPSVFGTNPDDPLHLCNVLLGITYKDRNFATVPGDAWYSMAIPRDGRIHFQSVSPVVMVHLKRLIWDNHSNQAKKSTVAVTISTSMPGLELRAVIVHRGNAGGGHYSAYVQSKGQWYHINDSAVKTVKVCEVLQTSSTQAHILVYSNQMSSIAPRGIKNTGSSCFINVCIHAFVHGMAQSMS